MFSATLREHLKGAARGSSAIKGRDSAMLVGDTAEAKMKIRKVGAEDAFFRDCECCGMEFRCGHHIYNGQNVPGWEVPCAIGASLRSGKATRFLRRLAC